MNTRKTPLLTACYDGQCGLCSAEMHEIHALDVQGDIALVDCSAPDFADEAVHSAGRTASGRGPEAVSPSFTTARRTS